MTVNQESKCQLQDECGLWVPFEPPPLGNSPWIMFTQSKIIQGIHYTNIKADILVGWKWTVNRLRKCLSGGKIYLAESLDQKLPQDSSMGEHYNNVKVESIAGWKIPVGNQSRKERWDWEWESYCLSDTMKQNSQNGKTMTLEQWAPFNEEIYLHMMSMETHSCYAEFHPFSISKTNKCDFLRTAW